MSPAADPPARKRAEVLAETLVAELAEGGFPVGRLIGSEAELIARLGVSRTVLREAVRVLENEGIAQMRRGPGGGLVVSAPDSGAAVRSSALVLEYLAATPEHVFEARSALELAAVELAARHIDESGITRIRGALEDERAAQETGDVGSHSLHRVLAEASGNPALALLIDVLTQLSRSDGPRESPPRVKDAVSAAHHKVAEAVMAGDVSLARHRMQRHLVAVGGWLKDGRTRPVAE